MPLFRCACGFDGQVLEDLEEHAASAHAGRPLSQLLAGVESNRPDLPLSDVTCARCLRLTAPDPTRNVQLCPTCTNRAQEAEMTTKTKTPTQTLTEMKKAAEAKAPLPKPINFRMPGTVLDILLAADELPDTIHQLIGGSEVAKAGGGKFADIGCTKAQAEVLARHLGKNADALQALPTAEKKAHPSGNVQGRIRNLRHTESVVRALLAGQEPPPRVANPGARGPQTGEPKAPKAKPVADPGLSPEQTKELAEKAKLGDLDARRALKADTAKKATGAPKKAPTPKPAVEPTRVVGTRVVGKTAPKA